MTWLRRSFSLSLLFTRYKFSSMVLRKLRRHNFSRTESSSLDAMFINLGIRSDRRAAAERQFISVGITASRVDAVADEVPLAGCARSHVKAIRSWSRLPGTVLMVAEDDVEFATSGMALSELIEEFRADPGLHVLCLSHMSRGPFRDISANLAITIDTQTTGCYVIKPEAAGPLLKVFAKSAMLVGSGGNPSMYALDIMWKKLQQGRLVFAVPRHVVAVQAPSYSDIQKQWVAYFPSSADD